MKHLRRSLTLPLFEVGTVVLVFFLVVAVLGFADASYLTFEHFMNVIPPCSVTEGCATVLTSAYSAIFGIPTSLLGAIYYLAISIGTFLYLESKHGTGEIRARHASILKWTLMATAFGFGMSLWFIYLQLFILHSICIYCMGSATTSTILFITAIVMLRRSSKDQPTVL